MMSATRVSRLTSKLRGLLALVHNPKDYAETDASATARREQARATSEMSKWQGG